ncbi:GPDA-like protein, partial [Mya arenaria]
MGDRKRICIVGSGNWGSAIAKVVGNNVKTQQNDFEQEIKMWVFEEEVNGRKLTEIINTDHENVKYLPGHKIPENVIAIPDVVDAAKDADIYIFVIPHQFLPKGFNMKPGGGIALISSVVEDTLKIPCAVLMGANIANEVAAENYCEATIGIKHKEHGQILKKLFQADYFRIVVCDDEDTNIVAVGAGFADGLGYGDNTKAAVIRLGLMEMVKFCEVFYHGRNRRVAEAFVKSKKSIEQLEGEMLNGQKLQGPPTAEEVNFMLKSKNNEDSCTQDMQGGAACGGVHQLSKEPPRAHVENHPK